MSGFLRNNNIIQHFQKTVTELKPLAVAYFVCMSLFILSLPPYLLGHV